MTLRVPHPWFVRVGSYDQTPQTFLSLLSASCYLIAAIGSP
jgi:hypothetical protein